MSEVGADAADSEKLTDLAKALRSERFETYKIAVEMADRVSQRRQAANTFYLSINTFLITASAYIGTAAASPHVTLLVSLAGIAISLLWTKAIESYKTLNAAKYRVINAIEVSLVEKPYTREWDLINPAIHGKQHRPFHQTEQIVPRIFIFMYLFQILSIARWDGIIDGLMTSIYGGMD